MSVCYHRPLFLMIKGLLACLVISPAHGQNHEVVSVNDEGVQGNGNSSRASISADGRYVAFKSAATDLVPAPDLNGAATDIFLYDRLEETITRVSENAQGENGNDESLWPRISADGNFVAFYSFATNLIEGGDLNGAISDVYVWNRANGSLEMVSYNPDTGEQGNNVSRWPDLSSDGRFVAYSTAATNLFVPDANGSRYDAVIFDRAHGTLERVSVNSAGLQANNHSFTPIPSGDGRFVAFWSQATNLISGGGPDVNGALGDVFIHDRSTGATELVSVNDLGQQSNGFSSSHHLSADGRYLVFASTATNLDPAPDGNGSKTDIFLRDRTLGTTAAVSLDNSGLFANDRSGLPTVSADGRFVGFSSNATNLVPGGDFNGSVSDIFVRDRSEGLTYLISANCGVDSGNDNSWEPRLTPGGQTLAFSTAASDLLFDDTNGHTWDVLVSHFVGGVPPIDVLMDLVIGLQSAQDDFNDLLVKVENTARLLQDRSPQNDAAACGLMDAFINEVKAQAGQRIPAEAVMPLIDAARVVQTEAGCSDTDC